MSGCLCADDLHLRHNPPASFAGTLDRAESIALRMSADNPALLQMAAALRPNAAVS